MVSRTGTIDDVVSSRVRSNSLEGTVDPITEVMVRLPQGFGLIGVAIGINEALTYGIDEISSLFVLGGAAVAAVAQAYRNWYANIGPITATSSDSKPAVRSRSSAYGRTPTDEEMWQAYGFKPRAQPQVRQYSQAAEAQRVSKRRESGVCYADLMGGSRRAERAAAYDNVVPMRAPKERAKPALLAAVDSYSREREAATAYQEARVETERHAYTMKVMSNYPTKPEPNAEMYDPALDNEIAATMKMLNHDCETGQGTVVEEPSLNERIEALESIGGVHGHSLELVTGTYLPVRPKRHERQQENPAA